MDLILHRFYTDNEENVYRVIALKSGKDGYAEVVLEMQGDVDYGHSTLFYSVFYRGHYAWLDRENPEFRLTEEVFYTPHVVRGTNVNN